ncbi:hypothetical protein SPFM15_00092 [Salmonella phage SPFM15]|nr:hypothetical protein SPFM5_00087 [Salmonella phage SPFM5]VFR13716.1 hypothetical protein SPFM15_00092 [Salmonella phage SPFM15]
MYDHLLLSGYDGAIHAAEGPHPKEFDKLPLWASVAYNCSGIWERIQERHPEKGLMEIYHQHPHQYQTVAQKKGRLLTETNEFINDPTDPFVDMGNFRDILSIVKANPSWLINHVSLEITNPAEANLSRSQVVYKDIDVPAEPL